MDLLKSVTGKVVAGAVALAVVAAGISWWQMDDATRQMLLFSKTGIGGSTKAHMDRIPFNGPEAVSRLSADIREQVEHDLELLDVAGNPFSREPFLVGQITPVFFASALTNFGIENFFDAFVELAPSAQIRLADGSDGTEIAVDPIETPFSAYVFKLQANMNPRHRDSTAFLRVCSGRFERDMVVKHHRLGTEVRLSRPHSLVAQERNTVDVAYPGDIIGIINPGTFAIGDTISLSNGFNFKPLPQFQPEMFARIHPTDVGKRKAFDKGMMQMAQEGTVQILRSLSELESFVAAVGRLQFDVLQYRLRQEYRVETVLTPLPFECSAWLLGDPATFKLPMDALIVKDRQDRPVVLFPTQRSKTFAAERNPDHRLQDMG